MHLSLTKCQPNPVCICYVVFGIFAMHKHLERASKRRAPHSGAAFLRSPLSPVLLRSLPCFPPLVFCPSSNTPALLQILFSSLSADWLAHLPEDKVPGRENRRKHTRARTRATQANTCNHVQTQACALGAADTSYAQPPMHRGIHARRGRPAAHTHKHTLPKSSSVMPSHPTLDKPLCEPDKAGEGTQQPLNTGAGCIRQLSVPVRRIPTLNCRALCPALYDSGKT